MTTNMIIIQAVIGLIWLLAIYFIWSKWFDRAFNWWHDYDRSQRRYAFQEAVARRFLALEKPIDGTNSGARFRILR